MLVVELILKLLLVRQHLKSLISRNRFSIVRLRHTLS